MASIVFLFLADELDVGDSDKNKPHAFQAPAAAPSLVESAIISPGMEPPRINNILTFEKSRVQMHRQFTATSRKAKYKPHLGSSDGGKETRRDGKTHRVASSSVQQGHPG